MFGIFMLCCNLIPKKTRYLCVCMSNEGLFLRYLDSTPVDPSTTFTTKLPPVQVHLAQCGIEKGRIERETGILPLLSYFHLLVFSCPRGHSQVVASSRIT